MRNARRCRKTGLRKSRGARTHNSRSAVRTCTFRPNIPRYPPSRACGVGNRPVYHNQGPVETPMLFKQKPFGDRFSAVSKPIFARTWLNTHFSTRGGRFAKIEMSYNFFRISQALQNSMDFKKTIQKTNFKKYFENG